MTLGAAQRRDRLRAARLSVGISILLLAVKGVAWLLTGSAAVLSDALESVVNVVAAGFALFSVRLADRPPDENHPYGHGKIEFVAAAFEGGLIGLAGALILVEAIKSLTVGVELAHLDAGVGLTLGAGLVNLWLGVYLVRVGRRAASPTLEADGLHVLSDVWTTGLVAGGLALVLATGWTGWDPLAAVVAAVNLLWMGARLVRQAIAGLMDEADQATLRSVEMTLGGLDEPTLVGWTSLRARCQGNLKHVDLTIHVPEQASVLAAHQLADRVERAIATDLGAAEVLVHVEPASLLPGDERGALP